ncbi:hypothetical protein [Pandoraea sp. NPDC087047]|uniref:hypothetical protein n=1 Tax=Pandoraea sp. NPDC087047 TaxID=3364390 RepID=UPI0037F72457
MEHPGSQDMREAVERLAAAMDKSRKELEGLARRDVALRARYRTSVVRAAEHAIPDLRRRTLDQLRVDHGRFVDAAVLDIFARNSALGRVLKTRWYTDSLMALRESFGDYIGRSGTAPFASARTEISAIETLMVRAREQEVDAAGVLAGLRCALVNEIPVPDEIVTDIRLVCRPRARKVGTISLKDRHPNENDAVSPDERGVSAELSSIPQSVRQFAWSMAVA